MAPRLTRRQRELRARISGATARGNTELAEQARQEFRALALEEHIRRTPLPADTRAALACLLLSPAGARDA